MLFSSSLVADMGPLNVLICTLTCTLMHTLICTLTCTRSSVHSPVHSCTHMYTHLYAHDTHLYQVLLYVYKEQSDVFGVHAQCDVLHLKQPCAVLSVRQCHQGRGDMCRVQVG